MEIEDQVDKTKVTLSVEIKDLIDIVSKSRNNLSLSSPDSHTSLEAEELKKAWFRHLLVSLEKLHDIVETIRREDLPELKKELKKELNELERELKEDLTKIEKAFKEELDKIEKEYKSEIEKNIKAIEKVDDKLTKSNEALEKYKTDVINPLNDKVTVLITKMAIIGFLAGGIGSIIFIIIKELLEIT